MMGVMRWAEQSGHFIEIRENGKTALGIWFYLPSEYYLWRVYNFIDLKFEMEVSVNTGVSLLTLVVYY